MTDKKFTLLELHIHDGVQMAIGDRIGDRDGVGDHDEGTGHGDHDDEHHGHSHAGRNAFFLTLGLLIGIGAAVAVRKLLGSELEAAEELDAMAE